jgi:hypothetical protein
MPPVGSPPPPPPSKGLGSTLWIIALVALGIGGGFLVWFIEAMGKVDWTSGGAWGRPLRVRGRILHPKLREGSDWTRGAHPDAAGLDEATRAALEALWLHDAQKEHASVPAFARISWLLAAVGAPAELIEGAHRTALEEIDHARRCFALLRHGRLPDSAWAALWRKRIAETRQRVAQVIARTTCDCISAAPSKCA